VLHSLVSTKAGQAHLTRMTDVQGREIRIEYDVLGRATQVIDPRGITTTLAYDSGNRIDRVTQTPADGSPARVTSFTYDAVDNLLDVTDPLSRTTEFTYDAAGRVVEQTCPMAAC